MVRLQVQWLVAASFAALVGCSADDGAVLGRYASAEYGLEFQYPGDLYVLERLHGAGEAPRLSVVLVEDHPMNRAYLAGTLEGPLEGPPMLTVDVYDNAESLAAADWVEAHTNWILTDKRPERIERGERSYLVYYWDGLYAGKSAVAVAGGFTYVFSVAWISEDDRLLGAFTDLLDGARLARD